MIYWLVNTKTITYEAYLNVDAPIACDDVLNVL
jgi:hypothetical protein